VPPAPAKRARKSKKEEAPDEKKKPKRFKDRAREEVSGSKFLSISTNEKIMFSKHLAIMLEAGIPLREALEVMREETTSKAIKRILDVGISDLSNGFALSTSLEKFPRVFRQFSINMVRVGESSGTLSKALLYEALELEKSHELVGKVKGALTYPIIIFVGAMGVGGYLSFYILPKLIPVFSSMSVKLPAMTRALLAGSTFIRVHWLLILGAMALLAGIGYVAWRIRPIRFALESAVLHIPLFGKLIRGVQVAHMTRILGTLLTSGVQIVEAIRVTSRSTENLVYKQTLDRIAVEVERGEEITSVLTKERRLFPPIVTGMVKIGDRTGKLSESLITAAEFSEKEVDVLTKALSTMIEPITLLLVGGLVGFIALSIITPIYGLSSGVGGGGGV
jgi:type IV pilus assembly protein PilC